MAIFPNGMSLPSPTWDLCSVSDSVQWRYFRMGCLFCHHMNSMFDARQRSMAIFRMECLFCRLLYFMFYGATAFEQTLCWDLMSESETDSMFDGSSGGLDQMR
jgi:hypothetical protein